MGSLNKVQIIGNLARDPEVRFAQSGGKIVTMSVATNERWKDKNTGEQKDRAEFHRVVIFNDHLADVAEKYLKKGSKVYLEGQLQTRKWAGQDGVDKYTTEIVLGNFKGELQMLDSRERAEGGETATTQPSSAPLGGGGGYEPQPGVNDLDDEIPFLTRWSVR